MSLLFTAWKTCWLAKSKQRQLVFYYARLASLLYMYVLLTYRHIHRVPSQYDIADYFRDFYVNGTIANGSFRNTTSSIVEQISLGQAGSRSPCCEINLPELWQFLYIRLCQMQRLRSWLEWHLQLSPQRYCIFCMTVMTRYNCQFVYHQVFAERARDLQRTFALFRISDCGVIASLEK